MIDDIKASDTALVCNIGCDLASSEASVLWAAKYPWVYGTVGIHPEFAYQLEALPEIKRLAAEDKIVAIGEIGLDHHWKENPPKDIQRSCFEAQIELAKELSMPICIHSRDADQETLDILKACRAFDSIKVLMHCYSGGAELARQYLALGAWISVAGPLTYKNNKKTPEVVRAVPLDRLLIETDSPYLTPEPLRGRPNTPANVKYTAMKVAEIKGISLEEAAEATFNNALSFYDISL